MEDLENKLVPNEKLLKLIKKKNKITGLHKLKKDNIKSFVKENVSKLIEYEESITDEKSGLKFMMKLRNDYLKEYKQKMKEKPLKPDKVKKPSKPDKFLLENSDGEEVYVGQLDPGSPPILDDKVEEKEDVESSSDDGIGVGFPKDKQKEEEESPPFHPDPFYNSDDEKDEKDKIDKIDIDSSSSDDDGPEPEYDEEIISDRDIDGSVVNQHRKAFVKWVNEDFYKKVKELEKDPENSESDSPLRVYQILVQQYLRIDTPYRGLMVYHGLGTGKTATAIILAEGLSKKMKINTILPASLEMEFIKEVQRWGHNELNKNNLWTYHSQKDLTSKGLKDEVKSLYKLDEISIGKVMGKVKRAYKIKIKKENIGESKEIIDGLISDANDEIKSRKGVWVPDKQGSLLDTYDEYDQEYILQQINYLIELKYNFIHYNPFPKVKSTSLTDFLDGEEDDDDHHFFIEDDGINTKNKKIVKELEKKLEYNQKTHHINSPFYREVIIIDEVHNFVRQIVNGNKKAHLFYEWILNARDVKLVFLSGTPVINKPSEIAVLYNMLKGLIKIYNFSVKTDLTPEDVTEKLTKIYYKNKSSIELFFVQQEKGKLVISYIQESSGFESLLDEEEDIIYTMKNNDKTFQEFISEIYRGLHKTVGVEDVIPSQDTYDNLSDKDKRSIERGKSTIFDKDLDLVFNREQRLFDINEPGTTDVSDVSNDSGDKLIDMTNTENFYSYFFEKQSKIPNQKRTLLKRMLMGLTSYYPIDRTSIVDMPQVTKPTIIDEYFKDSPITKSINIVKCPMSQMQFEKYSEMWIKEKEFDEMMRKKEFFNDEAKIWHYKTRTRQSCNIVYSDDEFRMMKKTKTNGKEIEDLKHKTFSKLLDDKVLHIDNDLNHLSPKIYEVLKNIGKYINKDGEPTGSILFYSDFRSDAGSEAFELALKSNGYERFDTKNPQTGKGKRYTFITGSEGQDERRIGRDAFNDPKNKYGEYIQIMIISSAGAEGISLKCVRQVHILEPYWNYVRMDQVFGRAIRMKSHLELDEKERTVEQYLYLSTFPEGDTYDMIYNDLKRNETWSLPECESDKVIEELSKANNRDIKSLFDMIITIRNDSGGESTDIHLFGVMQRKYLISLEINSVIKESSLDCIQHTRDDPILNDKCIRFSDKLNNEIAYFPGIGSRLLELVDAKQLEANLIYHIKPNIYVIYGYDKTKRIFIYYQYDKEKDEEIDIRYIRDNGTILGEIYENEKIILKYVSQNHPHNEKLGKEFSVYQEMYSLYDDLDDLDDLDETQFPSLDRLTSKDNLEGYKLKYNINDTYYFLGKQSIVDDNSITKIYPYKLFVEENYTEVYMKPIIIYNGKLYIEE